jgi:hypothetical protein
LNAGLLRRVRSYFNRPLQVTANQSLFLLGRMASWQVRSMAAISALNQVEFKVSSQWGEDGIIDWIIERAQIPPHLHSFVEFGVESYLESNTRFLLQNRNWRGLVLDGSSANIELLKKRDEDFFWRYDFNAKSAFITKENINDLLVSANFSGEIGLLSIDIDGNDYWVWEAINVIRPIICVCEYNAVFGDVWPISIPYDEDFTRNRPHVNTLYFGASIAALCSLGTKKGYRFLGTNSEGVNAFFIREDFAPHFASLVANAYPYPSRFRESRDASGRPTYVAGLLRAQLIQELPVVNTETGAQQTLNSLSPLYSQEWHRILES